MPKLRLEEVLSEHAIPPELEAHVARVRAKGTTFDKLDDQTASDLGAIAEALKISVFDLFTSSEQLYRLKIIQELAKKFPAEKSDENLIKGLHEEILKSVKDFPISVLIFYATQSLPKSILKNQEFMQKYIEPICKALDNIDLSSLEEEDKTTGLTFNDMANLTGIPISLLGWLRTPPKPPRNSNTERVHSSEWVCNYCQQTGNIIACWLC